jgi:N-acetylated-alpha-linked acidic dipeptidase
MKTKSEKEDKLLDEKAFILASDPTETYVAPPSEGPAPMIDFAPLDAAVVKLKASAKAYDDTLASGAIAPAHAIKANAILQDIDQSLLDERGLPGRPWYKNLAYAPGVLTGYGAKTLPGVREAIEGRRWAEAQTYVERTAKVLEAYAARVDAAAAALR